MISFEDHELDSIPEGVRTKVLELILQNTETEQDLETAITVILKVCAMFGIVDKNTGKLAEEIKEGGGAMFGLLTKALLSIVADLTKSKLPAALGGAAAQEAIKQRFSFFGTLPPLIDRHGEKFERLVNKI